MKNVLIISGHPDLKGSVANVTILEALSKALPEAEIRRLGTLYPDYQFDIEAEQAALLKADVIVLQFPFSWYSMPGLLKLWLDKVFLHGFSHGSRGKLGARSFWCRSPPVHQRLHTRRMAPSSTRSRTIFRSSRLRPPCAGWTSFRLSTPMVSAIPRVKTRRRSRRRSRQPGSTPIV